MERGDPASGSRSGAYRLFTLIQTGIIRHRTQNQKQKTPGKPAATDAAAVGEENPVKYASTSTDEKQEEETCTGAREKEETEGTAPAQAGNSIAEPHGTSTPGMFDTIDQEQQTPIKKVGRTPKSDPEINELNSGKLEQSDNQNKSPDTDTSCLAGFQDTPTVWDFLMTLSQLTFSSGDAFVHFLIARRMTYISFSMTQMMWIISVKGIVGILRVVPCYIIDKLDLNRTVLLALVTAVLGIGCMVSVMFSSYSLMMVYGIFYGFGQGTYTVTLQVHT